MIDRQCHRCGTDLHIESEGALTYCFHCGAPQIFLSEELQDQAAERLRLEQQGTPGELGFRASTRPDGVNWKQIMKLSLSVSGVLAALSIVLPPLGLLVFAWAPVAPSVVISLYAARARHTRFTAGTGARVGVICGIFIAASLAILNTVKFDISRFALHRSGFGVDMNAVVAQVRTQAVAQSGPEAAEILNMFNVPEFRAGYILAVFGLLAVFILLLATGGGALAGALQKRSRAS